MKTSLEIASIPSVQKSSLRSRIGLLTRTIGFVCSVALVISLIDLHEFRQAFLKITPLSLTLCAPLALIMQAAISLRWKLLAPNTSHAPPWSEYFLLTMTSSAANIVFPGVIGFDVMRAMLLASRVKEKKHEFAFSVVADRCMGLFSVVIVGCAGMLFMSPVPRIFNIVYGTAFVLLLVIFIVFFFFRKALLTPHFFSSLPLCGSYVSKLLAAVQRMLWTYAARVKEVLQAQIASCLSQMSWCLLAFILGQNIGIEISFWAYCAAFSLVWIAVTLPISFMGLGISELSLIFLFEKLDVPPELSVALSLQLFLANLALGLVGIPLLWFFPPKKFVAKS